jgi:hypothetical protein
MKIKTVVATWVDNTGMHIGIKEHSSLGDLGKIKRKKRSKFDNEKPGKALICRQF